MKYLKLFLLTLCLITPAFAADEPASEASIKKLLAVTQMPKLVDAMYGQMDDMIKPAMEQALGGRPLNAKQRQIWDDMNVKFGALIKKEMGWEVLEPLTVEIYRQSLTEREVQGMIDFYQSPAGKAVVEKMPRIMQATTQSLQNIMMSVMPKVEELMEETVQEMAAAAE
jgi:hypothetical protein